MLPRLQGLRANGSGNLFPKPSCHVLNLVDLRGLIKIHGVFPSTEKAVWRSQHPEERERVRLGVFFGVPKVLQDIGTHCSVQLLYY